MKQCSEQKELPYNLKMMRYAKIARIAAEINSQIENIGARRLQTILSSLLEELLYAVPDDISSGEITIDRSYVDKQLNDLVTNKDLSHYIL
jgi:ATP-dependent HslUV protease ATP-binding subunit HslU